MEIRTDLDRVEPHEFAHAGDIGDIIYGLPAIREKGPAPLVLHHSPGKTAHGMSQARAASVATLLEAQDYITGITYSPTSVKGSNLDGFRDWWKGNKNLAEMHLRTIGSDKRSEEIRPWLKAGKNRRARVIFHRSPRYTLGERSTFPWRELVGIFGRENIAFVGSEKEHRSFTKGRRLDLAYLPTPTLLDLAEVINAADLFVGNQSSPHAIAIGLGRPTILEVCPFCDNCRFGWPSQLPIRQNEILSAHQLSEVLSHR